MMVANDSVVGVGVPSAEADEVAELPPPPRERLRDRLRRRYRSERGVNGLQFWLLFRGIPILAASAGLYAVSGIVIGWRTAYDVSLAITSPADTSAPFLAWILSLAGWLVAPSVAGAVAGHVVTTYIARRRRPVSSLFDEESRG